MSEGLVTMFEVRVAEDVLRAQPQGVSEFPGVFSGWLGPVMFLVEPPSDADEPGDQHATGYSGEDHRFVSIARAAEAAAERFELVTDEGVELPGAWVAPARRIAQADYPRILGHGVVIGAYMKDEIPPEQGDTLLRVLLGELHSRRVSARVSCPPPDIDFKALPRWLDPEAASPPAAPSGDVSTKRWFIVRTHMCRTTTGQEYAEEDWLQPDGTWTRSKAAGQSFDADQREEMLQTLTRVRAESEPLPGLSLTGVLTSPDAATDAAQFPPESIRDHGHAWLPPTPSEPETHR